MDKSPEKSTKIENEAKALFKNHISSVMQKLFPFKPSILNTEGIKDFSLYLWRFIKENNNPDQVIRSLFALLSDENPLVREIASLAIAANYPPLVLDRFPEAKPLDKKAFSEAAPFFENKKAIIMDSIQNGLSSIQDNNEKLELFLKSLLSFHGYYDEILNIFQSMNRKDCKTRFESLVKLKLKHRYKRQLMVALTYDCNLKCEYCYSMNLKKRFPHHLSIENFRKILDWSANQNLDFLSFTGGEPTVNPFIYDMVKMVNESPLNCYFATNNLYPVELAELLADANRVVNITVHINDRDFYSEEQWQRFQGNLKVLTERKKDIYLRYNVIDRNQNKWDFIFQTAKRYGIGQINFAIPFPNERKSNYFISSGELKQYGTTVMDFIRMSNENNIKARVAKPFPLCIFSKDQIKELVVRGCLASVCTIYHNNYTYNLVVNPDLSVMPCIAMNRELPLYLLDFKSLEKIGEHYKKEMARLQKKAFYPECFDCELFYKNQCQGACLSYKMDEADLS